MNNRALEGAVWDKNKSEATLTTDGTDYRSETRPWHTILKRNLDETRPLYYEAEGKFISFKPVGTKQGELSATYKSLTYNDVWTDASLIVELSRDHWKKLIRVDKPPVTINKFVDYTFEVETDFKIDTKQERIKLGEFTSMEIAQAWDSSAVENKIRIECLWSQSNGKYYLTKRIPSEWLSKAVFPIYTDVDIAWGTASEFEDGDILLDAHRPFISCCEIDTNKFVVAYYDDTDGDAGKARVGTVSGTTITWGDISEFCSDIGEGYSTGVCKLNTDKFVVVYADDVAGDDGFAIVGTVSTRTISWGTSKEFETGDAEQMKCCQLGTDKFAIVYNDETDSDTWKVCVCTVSGTTITSGTPATLIAGDAYNWGQQTGICKLDTDKFAAFVSDGDEDGMVYAITVSGTTCTVGTGVEIEDAGCLSCNLTQLDTDKFVAVWSELGNIRTNVCTVSTRTITKNTEQDSGYNTYQQLNYFGASFGVTSIDSTHFIITFVDVDDSNKGKSVYCTVSGTTVTFGSRETFHDAATQNPTVCVLTNPAVAVCAYCDDADASDHGEAVAGTLPGAGGETQSVGGAVLTPAATLSRKTSKTIVGVVTPSSIIGRWTKIQIGQGIVSSSSVLGRAIKILIGGSITPVGVLLSTLKILSSVGQGAVTSASILGRKISKVIVGSITPAGTLGLKISKLVVGTVASVGVLGTQLTSVIQQVVGEGTIAISGALGKVIKIVIGLGSITPAGMLNRLSKIGVGYGSIAISGTLSSVKKVMLTVGQGVITPATILGRKILITITGSLTPTGALSTITKFFQLVGQGLVPINDFIGTYFRTVGQGIVSSVGTLGRTVKILAGFGTVTISGALISVKVFLQDVGSGAIAISGMLARTVRVLVGTGTVTISGLIGKVTRIIVGTGSVAISGLLSTIVKIYHVVGQGVVASVGVLGRVISISIGSGSIAIAGTLSAALILLQNVGQGTVTIAGTLGRTIKTLVGAGSIAISGLLDRVIKVMVGIGSVAISGTLFVGTRIYQIVGFGIVTIAGTVTRLSKIIVGIGSVTSAGLLGKLTKITVGIGSIAPTGTLTSIIKFLQSVGTGTITSIGIIGRKILLSVGIGTVSPSGYLLRKIMLVVGSGIVTSVGILSTIAGFFLSVGQGIVASSSSLGRKISIAVGGVVTSIGALAIGLVGKLLKILLFKRQYHVLTLICSPYHNVNLVTSSYHNVGCELKSYHNVNLECKPYHSVTMEVRYDN